MRWDSTTALVTGANKGIGLEFCRQLLAKGASVIATCRRSSTELTQLGIRVIEQVEMTDQRSCVQLTDELRGVLTDLLILNAGVFDSSRLGELNFERMLHEYDVNALGPLRVVQALLPNLVGGAKIVLVSSRAGSIGDNSSGGIYGYRMSKAALNMAGVSLARDLRERGIAVLMLHPGVVDTDLLRSGQNSLRHVVPSTQVVLPNIAVAEMLLRIEQLTLETSGRFLHRGGQLLLW